MTSLTGFVTNCIKDIPHCLKAIKTQGTKNPNKSRVNVIGWHATRMKLAFKDFHKQRKIAGIVTIDVNKSEVSHKVSCNNGKDW